MHHRGHDEGEGVLSGGESVSFLDDIETVGKIEIEILLEHGLDLAVADHNGLRIAAEKRFDGISVVRLHVRNYKIVEFSPLKSKFYVLKKSLIYRLVHGIEKDGELVLQEIGIIRHAVGNAVNTFKTGKSAVIDTDPCQIIGYFSCKMHIDLPIILSGSSAAVFLSVILHYSRTIVYRKNCFCRSRIQRTRNRQKVNIILLS